MTYEQASPRGLAYRRSDEHDCSPTATRVVHHFTAAITTMETAARNREALLRDYLEFRRSAVAEGEKGPVREYLVPPGADPAPRRGLRASAGRPRASRCAAPTTRSRSAPRTLPAGHLRRLQPRSPLSACCGTSWSPTCRWTRSSSRSRSGGARSGCGDQIYDVTAWSLPLLFDVEVVDLGHPRAAFAPRPCAAASASPAAACRRPRPWLPDAVGIRRGGRRSSRRCARASGSTRPASRSRIGGRKYDVGTAIVRVVREPAGPARAAGRDRGAARCRLVPLDSTWVDEGMSLGSNEVVRDARRRRWCWPGTARPAASRRAGRASCSSSASGSRSPSCARDRCGAWTCAATTSWCSLPARYGALGGRACGG